MLFRSKNCIVIAWACLHIHNTAHLYLCDCDHLQTQMLLLWSFYVSRSCGARACVNAQPNILSMGFNLFHVIRRSLQTREFIHLFVINISCALQTGCWKKEKNKRFWATNRFIDTLGAYTTTSNKSAITIRFSLLWMQSFVRQQYAIYSLHITNMLTIAMTVIK